MALWIGLINFAMLFFKENRKWERLQSALERIPLKRIGGSVVVPCLGCNSRFKVSDSLLGKPRKCPKCQETLEIPHAQLFRDLEEFYESQFKHQEKWNRRCAIAWMAAFATAAFSMPLVDTEAGRIAFGVLTTLSLLSVVTAAILQFVCALSKTTHRQDLVDEYAGHALFSKIIYTIGTLDDLATCKSRRRWLLVDWTGGQYEHAELTTA